MKLIAYIPAAGIPEELGDLVRLMHIEATEDELPVGHYPTITLFDHKLHDVDVIEHDGRKFVAIQKLEHVVCCFDQAKCQTEEYQLAFGENAAAPNSGSVIDAHILKGKMPTLAEDYARFIQWFRTQLESLKDLDQSRLQFKRGDLIDIEANCRYDLWAVYRHYLMLNGAMTLSLTQDGTISIDDPYKGEHSIHDWLIEINRRLQILAAENDMLAMFINFSETVRREQDFAFYAVVKDGSYSKHPVDPSEFFHLAHHYFFPDITVNENKGITFDYRMFYPPSYHEFNDNAWRYSEYARKLLPFI